MAGFWVDPETGNVAVYTNPLLYTRAGLFGDLSGWGQLWTEVFADGSISVHDQLPHGAVIEGKSVGEYRRYCDLLSLAIEGALPEPAEGGDPVIVQPIEGGEILGAGVVGSRTNPSRLDSLVAGHGGENVVGQIPPYALGQAPWQRVMRPRSS